MKDKVIRIIWLSGGLLLLGVAYVGVITPGIPWSTPIIGAVYCFARSNQRLHGWVVNHKMWGPYIANWQTHQVFPSKAKWMMIISMDVSLIVLWVTTHDIWLVVGLGLVMACVATWVCQFPSSLDQAKIKNQTQV